MNATLLCVALLVPGYGEKDIRKALEAAGVQEGGVFARRRAVIYGPYEVLDFRGVRGTDALLAELCEIQPVEGLSLEGTDMTDTAMATVGTLKGLKYLDLNSTAITDAGLRRLEGMKDLELLQLHFCPNITDEGVARLQKALPKCKIEH
jgi:hypothetical protein